MRASRRVACSPRRPIAGADRRRMRPRTSSVAVARGVVLSAAAAGAFAFVQLRGGARPAAALGRRTSSRRRSRPGSTTPTRAIPLRRRRRGRGLRLRRRRAARPVPRRRRAARPRCTATRARSAARCGSRRSRSGHRPDRVDRRLSARRRRRRASSTWPSCGSASVELLRGLGDCRFERANEPLGVRRRHGLATAFSATWEGDSDAADAGGRRLPRPSTRPATRRTACADNRSSGRPHRAPATRAPIAAVAGLLRAVDAVQRLGPLRPARPAGQQRPPLLRPGDGAGAALADRARRAAAAVHGRRWLDAAPDRGMGIASYDLTGDGYPEVYLTSQGDNRLQTLAGGPDAADLPRHRPRARRQRRPAVHRWRHAAVDRLAPRVRGRQQRRLHRPVRLEGQRRRDSPTTRRRTRATCSSASPTGRSSRAPRRPAS